MAIWPCVVTPLYPHRYLIWQGVHDAISEANIYLGGFAIYTQPYFQFLFHILPVRAQEQPLGSHRHPPSPHHTHLGHGSYLPICQVDHLYPDPLCPLGIFRNSFTTNNYVDK